MAQEQPPDLAKGITGKHILGYGLAFVPPFVCYKVAESMALGAGMGPWAAIGIGSLGAAVGAFIAGGLMYLVFVRKSPPKA